MMTAKLPKPAGFSKIVLAVVVVIALSVMVSLAVSLWDMNFWPTDAEICCLPMAANLFHFPFISEIHQVYDSQNAKWLHGKEIFVVHTAIFQKLLNDTKTLRPLLLVCILSLGFSAILIFLVARRLWGQWSGFICFSFFITSFWPYVYVLFAKHQPLGLFYFLLALMLVIKERKRGITYFFSGAFLSLSVFSSTVSALYFPLYIAGWLIAASQGRTKKNESIAAGVLPAGLLTLLGFIIPVIFINYPDVAANIKGYFDYLAISSWQNHFFYNQPVVRQWVEYPGHLPRGGWLWVVRYLWIVLPVVFPVYLACIAYLVVRCAVCGKKSLSFLPSTGLVIILSLSAPLFAEIKQVAQYGANYFPFIVGALMLIGYSLSTVANSPWHQRAGKLAKFCFWAFFALIFGIHAVINANIFVKEVYLPRLATTFLSKKIEELGIDRIYTYANHPCRMNLVGCLNPQLGKKLKFINIENIYQAKEGFILIPPATGGSVYMNALSSPYNDFDKDIFLNELFRKKILERYSVASFDTLSSGRIWRNEEEVLSFRDLILHHFDRLDAGRAKVWLLDARKLQRDLRKNAPAADDIFMATNGIRNIGTDMRMYLFEGSLKEANEPTLFEHFAFKIYKVGRPKDGLTAYIYKFHPKAKNWFPYTGAGQSLPLSAQEITSDTKGAFVKFKFLKPPVLLPGRYRIVIYRTGRPSDKDFYRIYLDDPASIEPYRKAAEF